MSFASSSFALERNKIYTGFGDLVDGVASIFKISTHHSACVPSSQKPTLPLDFTILWAKPLRVGTKHFSQ